MILIVSLCLLTPGTSSAEPFAPAATINITTSNDEYNETSNGYCSLREAIESVNLGSGFGGCTYTKDGNPPIIDMQDHDLLMDEVCIAEPDTVECDDLEVANSLTIQGAGMAETVIDADFIDRIFYIDNNAEVTINDLSLINGKAQPGMDGVDGTDGGLGENGGIGTAGSEGEYGGAIYAGSGSLIINRVGFYDNEGGDGGDGGLGGNGGANGGGGGNGGAGGKGGDAGEGGHGGALYISNANVMISDSEFIGNAGGSGGLGGNGGDGGSGTPVSDVPGNGGNGGAGGAGRYGGSGGAIYFLHGSLAIDGCYFEDNAPPVYSPNGDGGNGGAGGNGVDIDGYRSGRAGGAGGAGGGSSSYFGQGGAVYLYDPATITDSHFYNNSSGPGSAGGAGGNGGAGGAGNSINDADSGGFGGSGGSGGRGSAGGSGGAIYATDGLMLTNTILEGNHTGNGGNGGNGGAGGPGGAGGSSLFSGNGGIGGSGGYGGSGGASNLGGGVLIYGGSWNIDRSAIYDNTIGTSGLGGSGGDGGDGGAGGGDTTEIISGGSGGPGGSGGHGGESPDNRPGGGLVALYTTAVSITNSTVSGNSGGAGNNGGPGGDGGAGGDGGDGTELSGTPGSGGDAGDGGDGGDTSWGGGLALQGSDPGELQIAFSTIVDNELATDPGQGGPGGRGGAGGNNYPSYDGEDGDPGINGVVGHGGGFYLVEGSVILTNSLVALNSGTIGPNCYGEFTSGDYNLMDDDDGCAVSWLANDLVNSASSPLNIGSLADNGGDIPTHAIQIGSVALDHIPSGVNGCGTDYTTDQRGKRRPVNAACEIGAFELQLLGFLPFVILSP